MEVALFDRIFIVGLLVMSLAFLVLPLGVWLIRKVMERKGRIQRRYLGIQPVLLLSGFLLLSIWCLRYAVGYYDAKTGVSALTAWEEIFNSIIHALQTFSMDEDYTNYITSGKAMMEALFPFGSVWAGIYGIYAALLNTVAPIAGGALIFEILAGIFPKIRLWMAYLAVWKEKYYFSELNVASVSVLKSLRRKHYPLLCKPVVVFTDVYTDGDNEGSAELLLQAKANGAICVQDDLAHAPKTCRGKRIFFLIDENEIGNLRTLAHLSSPENEKYLKNAKVYLFSQSENYIEVERQIPKSEGMVLIPVQRFRNLITTMLADQAPLYEPLIGREKDSNGRRKLNIAILGSGAIGVEMFISTYWFAQIQDCDPVIHVISEESEEAFWDKIDAVNPEIRMTTREGDPILLYNKQDHCKPYCKVEYWQCDAMAAARSGFVRRSDGEEAQAMPRMDYVLVALGSDEGNITAARAMCQQVGRQHIAIRDGGRTVINYVVYDPDLCRILNREKRRCFYGDKPDVFMQAVGSLDELYDIDRITMGVYMDEHIKRAHCDEEDYLFWANIARRMHRKYKAFCLGYATVSLFDVADQNEETYQEAQAAMLEKYRQFTRQNIKDMPLQEVVPFIQQQHALAWLEHRRWNAFTRIKGFRGTADYDAYWDKDQDLYRSRKRRSYKQMEMRLHPCLVECDGYGMRLDVTVPDNYEAFAALEEHPLDLLDELTVTLDKKGLVGYDLKYYDYPYQDFED